MSELEIRKSTVIDVLFTGGDYQLSNEQRRLYSTCNGVVKVLSVENGQEIFTIGSSDDPARVTCFRVSTDNSQIVVAYTSGIIKHFRLHDASATLLCQFRSTHTGPIMICIFSADFQTLYTGSSDFAVKVWSLSERICLQTIKGPSVVSALCLATPITLVIGYVEGQLRIEDLNRQQQPSTNLNIHTSRISAILSDDNEPDTVYIVSCDQTMSIIDLKTQKARKILPLYEPIEAAVYIKSLKQIATVGEEGVLKFWDVRQGTMVREKKLANKGLDGIVCGKNMLVCSTSEQNLVLVDMNSLTTLKQFAGFNDEVLDISFVSHKFNCIAVATNSPQLRLYDLTNFNCTLVEGHRDLVLGVDAASWDPGLLASCSKDNSCLLWRITNDENNLLSVKQIGIATGHTNSVVGVCFSKHNSTPFFVTVSNDSTLKLWSLHELVTNDEAVEQKFCKLTANATFVAHTKDITCVEVSKTDKLCVTGSMDKTAKLWHIDDENMQFGIAGTLSGHKRGIWSAKFSDYSQIVATGSGDCTIKLFSLADLTCQMTLEGHSFAVLNVNFINNSSQLLSTDSNGLLKMWTVKTGVCEKTVECHEDKIWTLQVIEPSSQALEQLEKRKRRHVESEPNVDTFELTSEERVRYVTGAADGRVIVWEDFTEEYAAEQARLAAERLAQIQTLDNFIRLEKFEEALKLTLTLEHPFQCYKTLRTILTKNIPLDKLFMQLDEGQLVHLLNFTIQWNTNTRTYGVSQSVLNVLFRCFTPQRLLMLPNYPDVVKALVPYTKRHFERLLQMQQDVAFINYVTSRMEALTPASDS